MEDPSRPVTGYPAHGYPPPRSNPNPTANGCPPPQPGTAYPYPPPPPHQQPYNYNPNPNPYYHAPPLPNRRSTFLRGFLISAIAVCIIFGSILLIFWLVVRPRLPEFSIDSLNLSNFSASQQQVSGKWDVRFQVFNANKRMAISYDDVLSSIYYKEEFIFQTRIPPFKQAVRDLTPVNASFYPTGSFVEGRVVSSINGDKARGTVSFNVKLLAEVGFKYGSWRARRRVLRVWCNDVAVGVSSSSGSGKLVGGTRQCRVA